MPHNPLHGAPNVAEEEYQSELGPWWDRGQSSIQNLISSLGLTSDQAGLFGDDFYSALSEMFPDIPKETLEQFIIAPQMQQYDTLIGQLQAQRQQQGQFLTEEYDYRGDELQRQIDLQNAQKGFLGEAIGFTETDIEARKKEAAEALKVTEADIVAREQEAASQLKITQDGLADQLKTAEDQYGVNSPQYKQLQTQYDNAAARYSTEEGKEGYETLSRREKLARVQELYGAESVEAAAIADQLSEEEKLYGEGGAESQAIAAELARAGTARTLDAAQLASRARATQERYGMQQARYGAQGLEATRTRQATQRARDIYGQEDVRISGEVARAGDVYGQQATRIGQESARAAQKLALEEARVGGQVGRAQQAYAAEAGRYAGQSVRAGEAEAAEISRIGGTTSRAGTEYQRAVARLGAGGIEQQRLGREEAAAGRTFGTTATSIEAERAATQAGLGRRAGASRRRFVEGSEAARTEVRGQRETLRARGAETGFTAAGQESMLDRVLAQRTGRALESMVGTRAEELGDIESQSMLTDLQASAKQSEAGERLRGVQEAGTYRRDILGQQLGEAGGAYQEALSAGEYGLERARLSRAESDAATGFGTGEAARKAAAAQEAGTYQLGTAGLAELAARQSGEYELGRAGTTLTSAEAAAQYQRQRAGTALTQAEQDESYGLGTIAQQFSEAGTQFRDQQAQQAYDAGTSALRYDESMSRGDRATAQRQAALAAAQRGERVATAQRTGRVSEAEGLYGETGAEARRLQQMLSEAGLDQTYGQNILGQQMTAAGRTYGTESAAWRQAGLQESSTQRGLGTMRSRAQDEEEAIKRALGMEGDRAALGYRRDTTGINSLLQGLGIQQGMLGLGQRRGEYDIQQQYQAGLSGIEGSLLSALQGIFGQAFNLSTLGPGVGEPPYPNFPGTGGRYGDPHLGIPGKTIFD